MSDPTPAPSAAPDEWADLRAAAEAARKRPYSAITDADTVLRLLDDLAAARAGAGEAERKAGICMSGTCMQPATAFLPGGWAVCTEHGGGAVDALADAIKDTLWRMTVAGQTEDGDVAHYIVTKGTVHRLVAAAQNARIDAALRNGWVPEPPEVGAGEADAAVERVRKWVVPNGYAGGPEGDPTTAVMVRLDDLRAALSGDPA